MADDVWLQNGAEAVARTESVFFRTEILQGYLMEIGLFQNRNPAVALANVENEIAEFRVEMTAEDRARMMDELGDIFFAAIQLARCCDIHPAEALASTNSKVQKRLENMRTEIGAEGKKLDEAGHERLHQAWQHAKKMP